MKLIPTLLASALLVVGTTALAAPAYLGVHVQEVDDDLREAMGLDDDAGVLIAEVLDDSPAEHAGLEEGDIVLRIDGRDVASPRALVRAIQRSEAGEVVRFDINRDGNRRELEVELGERMNRRDTDVRAFGRHHGMDIRPHRWFGSGEHNPPALERIEAFFGRPRLGVETRKLDDDLAGYFDVDAGDGVLVLEVMEETPAEEAGLKTGDVITHLDGTHVNSPGDLRDLILDHEGEEVTLEVVRRGNRMEVAVTLDAPEVTRLPRFSGLLPDDDTLRDELDALKDELRELKEELRELRRDR